MIPGDSMVDSDAIDKNFYLGYSCLCIILLHLN